MKTNEQRSNAAYSATLSHTDYASIDSSESMETKIEELLKGLEILCVDYGVNIQEILNIGAEIDLKNEVLDSYENIMLNNGLTPFDALKDYNSIIHQKYTESLMISK